MHSALLLLLQALLVPLAQGQYELVRASKQQLGEISDLTVQIALSPYVPPATQAS